MPEPGGSVGSMLVYTQAIPTSFTAAGVRAPLRTISYRQSRPSRIEEVMFFERAVIIKQVNQQEENHLLIFFSKFIVFALRYIYIYIFRRKIKFYL